MKNYTATIHIFNTKHSRKLMYLVDKIMLKDRIFKLRITLWCMYTCQYNAREKPVIKRELFGYFFYKKKLEDHFNQMQNGCLIVHKIKCV